ncbi:TPA: NTP transferase domain-containing protein [Candidatus Woesearchaeota archaeon]|nr:NTP transferase domain-containing protein [Candidatus Woesearchaeota archaeon]
MKERVTLTIDKDLLKAIDQRVDDVTVKNRSHAVELLVRQALRASIPSTAVILAGGKGSRLKPLTDKMPKALVPVNGKPIVQYNIELCKRFGVKNIILSVGHMADQIKERFGDGSALGVNISYIEEKEPMGTAGPLRLLKNRLTETFILMNGDEIKDVNLIKMYRVHLEHYARATIALTTVEDPSAYGVAMLDGNKIVRFVEKPKREDAPSNLINAGLYIIEPEVITLIPEGYSQIENDIFPRLSRAGILYGYPFSGQWFDTGTPERLTRAAKEWKDFTS